MKKLIDAWSKAHIGWRLFVAGVAMICGPIWATYGLGSALVTAGIFCLIAASFYSAGI